MHSFVNMSLLSCFGLSPASQPTHKLSMHTSHTACMLACSPAGHALSAIAFPHQRLCAIESDCRAIISNCLPIL